MFCLYCGTKLPDDAIFCNKCGKQQKATENEAATNIAILPFPMLPNISTGGGQSIGGDVPMVQGTPSLSDKPSAQRFVHSAGNAASSVSPAPIPPQTPSSASLASTQHAEQHQHLHRQIESSTHPLHTTPTRPTYIEPPASPAHHSHVGDRRIPSDGLKLTGKLSRRAVVGGLVGVTGLVIVGGGLTWFAFAQRLQPSTRTAPNSSQITLMTQMPMRYGPVMVLLSGNIKQVVILSTHLP